MKAELVTIRGNIQPKSIELSPDRKILIGRAESAEVQILDMGLSRLHCSIEPSGSTFIIRDADSRNGTWVNGRRITEVLLSPGDRVRVGGVEFEFRTTTTESDMEDAYGTPREVLRREFRERLTPESSDLMHLAPASESIENLRRVQRDLSTVYKIGNLVNAEKNIDKLYERVVDAIFEVISPDRAFLLLLEETDGKELEVVTLRQHTRLRSAGRITFSQTVARECLSQGVSILRLDAMADDKFGKAASVIDQDIHSVVCVPLESTDRILGVLYADRVASALVFSKHDLELLAAVGRQAGIAIDRARLIAQVRRMLYSTVRALVASIEAKDENTKGHSVRVTSYALQLGQALDVVDEELLTLELASLLHDVGKIGVDEKILRKPGDLTDREYELIRLHPIVGEEITRNIENSDLLASIVRHHHERWDGKGYPDGKKKDDIHLLARILTLADAYDAMTSWRPYRNRMKLQYVIEEIKKGAGSQFDPKVVTALLRELEHGRMLPG